MNQEVEFGWGSINNIVDVLNRHSKGNILFVTGKISYERSGIREALGGLITTGRLKRFWDFDSPPRIQDVVRGIDLFQQFRCDCILAAGGGSVIDMAKLINVFTANEPAMMDFPVRNDILQDVAVPLIAVPTTAGSGSEATHFAVVYKDRFKFSVAHPSVCPTTAIIDPELTANLPPRITATSGIDAIAQAIESYWSTKSTEESKSFARASLDLSLKHFVSTTKKPSREGRESMSKAAFLAGKAINISKTTGPHALSYSLTAWFGVPHGEAVSLTLPMFFLFNSEVTQESVIDQRGVKYVLDVMKELNVILGSRNAFESALFLEEIIKTSGLRSSLADVTNDSEGLINTMLRYSNLERLENNPRKVSSEILSELLKSTMERQA